MSWRPLDSFADRAVPKLANLRRAARAGLSVPPTLWARAADVEANPPLPPDGSRAPWIVRSASPTEDGDEGTQAGRFVSREATGPDPEGFRTAVRAVVASLPRDAAGRPLGAVFVQPLLLPERGGVAFFDGFYYELTTAPGGNRALTSGRERGHVVRGTLRRGEPWSRWLERVGRCFARELAGGSLLDLELALDGDEPVLLQARPARFAIRRNPVLSLANHREILGEMPSPWVVAALEEAGRDAVRFFAEADPEVGRWDEPYAVALGGRAWLNFSLFHRMMDRWGLPRAFVAEGVGGAGEGPEDERFDLRRMLPAGPRLVGLQLRGLLEIARAPRALAELERRIAAAGGLEPLFDATVFGLVVALRTNFALNGALTGLIRVRRMIGIRGRARVTTERMMEEYEAMRNAEPGSRETSLDAWLSNFGHRGPLESDLARPRFAELRDLLLSDLVRAGDPAGTRPAATTAGIGAAPFARGPLFALDRRRESFRDDLMRAWQRLRERVLEEAERLVAEGRLARAEDVFLVTREDLRGEWPSTESLARRRATTEALRPIAVPSTAPRSEIEAVLGGAAGKATPTGSSFRGIGLGGGRFEGRVRRASDLVALLAAEERGDGPRLDGETVLVVPALEPSWAVVFGRVGAVVAEIGGELSHASILLREAGKPAVVNCEGAFGALVDGERVRLDGAEGTVERTAPVPPVAGTATAA